MTETEKYRHKLKIFLVWFVLILYYKAPHENRISKQEHNSLNQIIIYQTLNTWKNEKYKNITMSLRRLMTDYNDMPVQNL